MKVQDKINLQKWWMDQLRELTGKVMKQEEKRQENEKKKCASMLADYISRDEIHEAYGMGIITEKKRNTLLDLWDRTEAEPSELYKAKMELLQDFYLEAGETLRGLGGMKDE